MEQFLLFSLPHQTCTLRLTVNKLYFILSDRVANGGVSMWCELCQGNFFDEFQMEGVAADHNEIYLELMPENLSRALKTAQSAKAVKIKLTNKHSPCLRVAVELPSLSSSSRIVTHDIPVRVIPRRLWNDFREPIVPDFDVSLCFYISYGVRRFMLPWDILAVGFEEEKEQKRES
uniref:Checkpoint protein n=1 Tax=Pavo cristatus TaxID=9049 RepID=A0A8C9FV23_PAVCR